MSHSIQNTTSHANRRARTARRLPLSAALLACLAAPAFGATILVDDPSAGSVEGHCTIVDAVAALNNQAAVNACAPGDGNNDVIDLTGFAVPTTITFTQAPSGYGHALSLTRSATIRAALASSGMPLVTLTRSTVSGTPAFGLIESGSPLTLYGLALTNGTTPYTGGAVSTGDALILDHCTVSGNSAGGGGGVSSTGSVTLTDSTVSGNIAVNAGGGVASNSTVHLYHSTIDGNATTLSSGTGGGGVYSMGALVARNSVISNNISASKGGGLRCDAFATIIDSTVTDNSALNGSGGGLFAILFGTAISGSTFDANSASTKGGAIDSQDVTLENSTFTQNVANTGAGAIYAKTFSSDYSTISGNRTNAGIGGGVSIASAGSANGTILYGNVPDDLNSPTQAALGGNFNLIGNSGWAVPADTINCDPQLGALADNGGPTMTMAPAAGSCAIDAASATPTETTDQRGQARPASGTGVARADIGAVEQQASENPDIVFAANFD